MEDKKTSKVGAHTVSLGSKICIQDNGYGCIRLCYIALFLLHIDKKVFFCKRYFRSVHIKGQRTFFF